MINRNTDNKPLYNSTYSFIAQVNGKKMEFVSEEEYEEYINVKKPIKIINKTIIDHRKVIPFVMKVVLYQRTTDGTFFVYKVSQYFDHTPQKAVYTYGNIWDAFRKYKELGGK